MHKVDLRKAIEMAAHAPLRSAERDNFAFFQQLPEVDRTRLHVNQVKDSQLLEPLFEFSRRLRRLWRDPLPEAAFATFRRADADRQCYRLLLHLRREPADHAVDGQP